MTDQSKGTWMGRPVEELSKDELIEALVLMSKLYEEALKRHSEDLSALTDLWNKSD